MVVIGLDSDYFLIVCYLLQYVTAVVQEIVLDKVIFHTSACV